MIDGGHVLALRTQRGLSQRKLASLVGVNPMTLTRIERGADSSDLPLSVLGRLADVLGAEPAELLIHRTTQTTEPSLTASPSDTLCPEPLDHNSAKLLRRIHRGEDVRRSLSRIEREVTLPALVNRGLVHVQADGISMTEPVASSVNSFDNR
jgi:transcriptional regulator with XRE-family HTH domain